MFIYNPKQKKGYKSDALVQTIDIAPTLLSLAGAPIPEAFQGKDLSGFINGNTKEVRDYVYTENLWSTKFGNPRCEAVQTKEWKYIRYYQNNNISAAKSVEYSKEYKVSQRIMLYEVHPSQFAVYRNFIEGPLEGEKPVYEELYHLTKDPNELHNLINEPKHTSILNELKAAWKVEIKNARGTGKPKVRIYTNIKSPV